MREAYITGAEAIDDGYTGASFNVPYSGAVSDLTRIELARCCMDTDGVSSLLRYTPDHTTFKYSHYTKWHVQSRHAAARLLQSWIPRL